MNRNLFLFLLVSSVLTMVFGCSKPKAPTLTPEKTEITGVTTSGITVRVTVNAHNPNDFGMSTRAVSATLKLGDQVELGPISKPHGVDLPANKSTNIVVEFQMSWKQAGQLTQLAASGATIPYEVVGNVTIGGEKLNVELPFTIKGQVTQAQLLAAGLRGLPSIPGLPQLQ